MAGGLILIFIVLQMALGIFFIAWLWIARVRSAKKGGEGRRDRLLWAAVISFTVGVFIDFYFMLARGTFVHHGRVSVLTSFSLACLAVVFALLGKGRGRMVTIVASGLLAISWLPFILP